ncbi:MAG: glutamate dehydrogenase [Gelidibacter sp.]
MALNFKQLSFILLVLLGINNGFAQLGFSHEIGVIAGPVAFQSDFGVRNNLETNAGNTGIGIGIVHYINFSYKADCNCYSTDTYFNDHFKLRSEISYNTTKLNHFGEWVDNPNPAYDPLRHHSGKANNLDIGMQLEFFPNSIRAFSATRYSFAPFISLGSHFTSYNPKAYTNYVDPQGLAEYGNVFDPLNIFGPWRPGPGDDPDYYPVKIDGGTTWSVVGSIGTRYKLTILSDLMVDLRWQYFFNNEVDGLDHKLNSDKANDWLVWLNFGYIYYLD